MSFFGSLFGGQNKTLDNQIGQLGTIAGSATQTGTGDVGAASTFWSNILQGGGAKALAPEISGIKKQGQQKIQSLSQFGNRGGGTNAEAATVGDNTTASINDLIAKLSGSAASGLAGLGTNLMGLGLNAFGQQEDASQKQMQNWKDSILGSGITGAVNYAESFLPVAHGG